VPETSGPITPATRRRVRAVRDRLRLVYGVPGQPPHGHPIAELILTVLSQSTNDRNRDVAYLALRERWPEWTELRDAPFDELHDTMLELTPRGQEWELHINMLRHGRRTCHARNPDCGNCALLRMCPRVGL
jgi:endonuclease III